MNRRDYSIVFCLGLGTLLFNAFGLGAIEFFRHTEADRTLIGWEMIERNDFIVPHLLNSIILTKPPFFYWTIAFCIQLFGTPVEWVVRLPSVIAAVVLVMMNYVALRQMKTSSAFAVLSTVALATSSLFFSLATVAEIDMVFGLFCTASLYSVYFIVMRKSLAAVIFGYVIAGLAFLTKGPPIVFFFAASLIGFYWWRSRECRASGQDLPSISWLVGANLVGSAIFSALVFSWLSLTASQVGWEALQRAFEVEIFERIMVRPLKNEKSPFFYAVNMFNGLLPWSLLGVLGWLLIFWQKLRGGTCALARWGEVNGDSRPFLFFNAIVFFSALVMLSISAGKTARYIFPVCAFAVNLLAVGMYALRGSNIEDWLLVFGKWFSRAGFLVMLGAMFLFNLEGVAPGTMAMACGAFVLCAAVLHWAVKKNNRPYIVTSLALFMTAYHFAERTAYAEFRNHTRSVKDDVLHIERLVPNGEPIFTVEMFERWVVYYLKREGRTISRVTPALAASPPQGRVYLLLSKDDEWWRKHQLEFHDPTLKLLGEFSSGTTDIYLLEIDGGSLRHLHPKETIPTVPSPPYYFEEKWLSSSS